MALLDLPTSQALPMTKISDLPDDVLATILADAAALFGGNEAVIALPSVCRRWRRVCMELVQLPNLNLDFRLDGKVVTAPDSVISIYLDRFKGVDSAKIVGYEVPKGIRSLDGVTVTPAALADLTKNIKVRVADERISLFLEKLLQPNTGLKSLSLILSYRSHAHELSGRCGGLTSVELGCGSVFLFESDLLEGAFAGEDPNDIEVDDELFYYYDENYDDERSRVNTDELIDDQKLFNILRGSKTLTRLKLRGFQDYEVCTDGFTCAAISACANLVDLDLTNVDINDQSIATICRSCRKVQRLVLGNCDSDKGLTDEGIRSIATLSELEVFEIDAPGYAEDQAIAFDGFTTLLMKCSKLMQIELNFKSAIVAIADAIEMLDDAGETATNLTKIYLTGSHDIAMSVRHAVTLCPKLKKLHCVPKEGMVGALRSMAQGCPHLESVSFRVSGRGGRDSTPGDADVRELADACPHLQSFHIWFSPLLEVGCDVTDDGIKAMLLACPDLTSIQLPPSRITDVGLYHISRQRKGLKALSVLGSPGVTIAGIRAVLNECPSLKTLRADLPSEWKEALSDDYPALVTDPDRYESLLG